MYVDCVWKNGRGPHVLAIMMKQRDWRDGRALDQRFLTWGPWTPWGSIDFNGSLNLDGGKKIKLYFL